MYRGSPLLGKIIGSTFRCLERSRRVRAERHLAAKVGTVRILYRAGTISLQAAVHHKYTLGALNMKEEEDNSCHCVKLTN